MVYKDKVLAGKAHARRSSKNIVYHIYILKNEQKRYYIGVTADLEERIKKHNQHGSKWTKNKGPWRLIYKEVFNNKVDALSRERQIKSYKGGNAFKKLINTKF